MAIIYANLKLLLFLLFFASQVFLVERERRLAVGGGADRSSAVYCRETRAMDCKHPLAGIPGLSPPIVIIMTITHTYPRRHDDTDTLPANSTYYTKTPIWA